MFRLAIEKVRRGELREPARLPGFLHFNRVLFRARQRYRELYEPKIGRWTHQAIDEGAYVERYVGAGLAAAELRALEEHLVDCARCVEQVAWAADFRGRAALGGYGGRALRGPSCPWRPWKSVATGPAGRGERAGHPPRRRARRRSEAGGALHPGGRPARWVVLSLELEGVAEDAFYRARLSEAGGREVWRADKLHAAAATPVSLLLPASLLGAGDHRLLVEGVRTDGRADAAGQYTFRVLRPAP